MYTAERGTRREGPENTLLTSDDESACWKAAPHPATQSPSSNPVNPSDIDNRDVARTRAEQPEGQKVALSEAFREHTRGQLQQAHGGPVGSTHHPDLSEAEAEGLREDREQDVDRGREPVPEPRGSRSRR